MASENKTHAEIIAEMQYKAGTICPWQVNGGSCELCPLGHSPHGRDLGKYCSFHKLAHELDSAHKREIDEAERRANHAAMKNVSETLAKVGPLYDAESIGNAAKLRERRLLMSCARWILCHDIYGHTAKELLAECKEVLNDDGQFLFKEDEQ